MSKLQRRVRAERDGVEELGQGQFIEWHKDEGTASLLWSSDRPLRAILATVAETIGPADNSHRGLVDLGDKRGPVTTADVARRSALEHPDTVSFLRLEFSNGVSMVWTPKAELSESAGAPYSEASIQFSPETAVSAVRTLEMTATERVMPLADMVVRTVVA